MICFLERAEKSMAGKYCSLHGHDANKGCVSSVPIFNHLEPEQLQDVMQVVQSISYKRGEILFHAGDESDSLYIVNSGQVKIYRLSDLGREQLVRLLYPGDFTGELALFKATVLENFAETVEDSQICIIKRDDLQRLLVKYPTISLKVLNEFANRLATSEKQTASFVSEKVETRIALYLMEQLEKIGNNVIELPMSKKDLASFLGTTPETLSRRLTEFETNGMIEQNGQRQIKIIDEALLLEV